MNGGEPRAATAQRCPAGLPERRGCSLAATGPLAHGDAGASVAVFVDGTMTALCALVLADRGELDLAPPVGRYWPEFAAAGKGKVLVRHLLAHTVGPGCALSMTTRVALTVPPPSRDENYAASAPGASAPPAAGRAVRVRDGNSAAWRRAQIPAASGFGNARLVALVQSVMACWGTAVRQHLRLGRLNRHDRTR